MRKDIGNSFSIRINRHYLHNWSIGIDYYEEEVFLPNLYLVKAFQINLLFFNIHFTKWDLVMWFPGV